MAPVLSNANAEETHEAKTTVMKRTSAREAAMKPNFYQLPANLKGNG